MKLLYGLVFLGGIALGAAAWSRRGETRSPLRVGKGASKCLDPPTEAWPHGGTARYGETPRRLHS